MAELILHHYDTSPFSEKVRAMLGVKGLAWRSVIQPVIMPKPELVPLTGGYRRIPVMQAGADVYCDSQVILEEIERRHPEPKVIRGADWAVNLFCDRTWFQASVAIIFARLGDAVPRAFIEDREKLSGRPFDVKAMQAAAPFARDQWRAYAAWADAALADAPFLGGERPSLADVATWMPIWWAAGADAALLNGLDNLSGWAERMRSFGHGQRTEMSPADALAAARAAEPEGYDGTSLSEGPAPGQAVRVSADDYGRDPIRGRLVHAGGRRIVIAREDPDLGRLNIHLPRAGYVLAADDQGA
ncbi:glutathione S-transferase family protein [Phenylobacterium sp.]|jgi:glutathione S-transferase|uniref:glutathione S-transferase family protein n=1 Tax=Phenylobacterium sp. TaxID=1871053 RepID=UPI002F924B27